VQCSSLLKGFEPVDVMTPDLQS